MKNNVVLLKLKHSFLDILCFVDDEARDAAMRLDSTGTIEVESPIIVQVARNPNTGEAGPIQQDLSFFSRDEAKDLTVNLRLDDILFATAPNEELQQDYRGKMSGIQTASASDLGNLKGS